MEVIASYSYARRRTPSTISVALSTLVGSAIMNSTWLTGLFLVLLAASGVSRRNPNP